MKNLFVLMALVLFTAGAMAKDNKTIASEVASTMEKELALNAEQKSKVTEMITQKLNDIDKYKKADLTDQEREESLMIRRTFITDLQTILTADQYKKWQDLRAAQLGQVRKGDKVENPVFVEQIEFMRN